MMPLGSSGERKQIPASNPPPPCQVPTKAGEVKEPAPSLLPFLEKLRDEYRIAISPQLLKIVAMQSRDPVLFRWLSMLELAIDPVMPYHQNCPMAQRLVLDFGADPHLFNLVTRDGDAYALYLYPPWCEAGREPVVVSYRHEVNLLDFEALTFDAFFDKCLSAVPQKRQHIVDLIRERLTMPKLDKSLGNPPEFLPLDATWGNPKHQLPVDPNAPHLDQERQLLRRYLRHEQSAIPELRALYQKLGWRYAAEQSTMAPGAADPP